MEWWLKIADLSVRILTEVELKINPILKEFLSEKEEKEDYTIHVSEMKEHESKNREKVGEDFLMHYYKNDDEWCCEAEGKFGAVVRTTYINNSKEIIYEVNQKEYFKNGISLEKMLQLFPMKQLLQRSGGFILHSSRIAYEEGSVLFTGKSGIGKTTQANLWENHRNIKILGNDRTVIRKVDGKWMSYGYFVDGSSPVYSNEKREVKAIVVLEQAKFNKIEKLRGVTAVKEVMQQIIIDTWNTDMTEWGINLLLELMKDIPIYRLYCTPDEEAVICLEEKLREDNDKNV